MSLKTLTRTEAPTKELSTSKGTELASLRQKTGMFRQFGVSLAKSKAASEALKTIELEHVRAEANIALTGLKLSEVSIRSSMIGNFMPSIGALTTRLNAATTAVDQALTNGAAAEVYTHLSNRAANNKMTNELHSSGKISKDEAEVLNSFAQADATDDIESSRRRMTEAKEAVSSLHSFALKGIADAKDRIF